MELLDRARHGDLHSVKTLIQERRVDVNTTNRYKQTALYFACKKGHTEVARYLLDNGASVDVGAKSLIVAVMHNQYDCVKLLLEYHADANCTNTKLQSPMSIALQKQHYSIILLLVHYNAIPSQPLGDMAVQLLEHAQLEHTKAIEKLLDRNVINLASKNTFLAAFGYAFKCDSVELVDRMLSNDSYAKIKQLYPDAVYYSAKQNWPTVLSKLVEETGVDVNALTDGQTPLYVACKQGHKSIVKLLLSKGADPSVPNELTTSTDFQSPLQIAVSRGNAMLVELLLEKGAKLLVHPHGEPLLHIACTDAARCRKTAHAAGDTRSVEHMLSVISLLMQQGVNVNAISHKGDTALYRACISQQLEVVQVLLEAGADVNLTSKGHYPLIAACDAGNAELIYLLLEAGADAKCRKISDETCLHAVINAFSVATLGSPKHADSVSIVSIVKSLLNAGAEVNVCSSLEETALYRASKSGHENVVRLLLEAGAETSGSTSHCPLYAACEQGHTQIVDLLLHHGADPNTPSTSSRRYNYNAIEFLVLGIPVPAPSSESLPICCAVEKGHTDIVNLLLKGGADVNKQNQSGKSALVTSLEMMISRRSETPQVSNPLQEKDLKMLKSMLSAGGDVNMLSGSSGRNALHIASSFGMCDVVMEMIQHGAHCNHPTSGGKSANIDVADTDGNTALHHAVQHYDPSAAWSRYSVSGVPSKSVVDILLQNKADVNIVNDSGETPLYAAASREFLDVVTKMLRVYGGNPNIGSPDKSPLVAACLDRNEKLVFTLLSYGADPNLASKACDSNSKVIHPLFVAVKNSDIDIVTSLLKAGADVNAVNREGESALLVAAQKLNSSYHSNLLRKKISVVRLLLEHGANCNTRTPHGHTPLYLVSHALQIRGACDATCVAELLQLLVKQSINNGTMLQDSSTLSANVYWQSVNTGTLMALATFDGRREFIVDMFRAGAGFQLIAHCCNAVATSYREAKSTNLCQAAVLAGYVPRTGELQQLQWAAANTSGHQIKQLLNWLNEDRQQVPSLQRQCRFVIRRQLSAAVHFRSILPAIDKLPLPTKLKLYVQFDGPLTEVDLSVNKELQT